MGTRGLCVIWKRGPGRARKLALVAVGLALGAPGSVAAQVFRESSITGFTLETLDLAATQDILIDPASQAGWAQRLNQAIQHLGALAIYDGLLRDHPGNAYALHEWGLTRLVMARQGLRPDTSIDDQAVVLAADPLYTSMFSVEVGRGTYHYTLRSQIEALNRPGGDFAASARMYADNAYQLGAPEVAGIFYWLILSRSADPTQLEALFVHYVASARAAGAIAFLDLFGPELPAACDALDAQLESAMWSHPAYTGAGLPQ